MWNHILSALVLAALVGTFASAPSPAPMPRSVVARTVPSQPAAASQDIAGALAGGSGLQVRQPPIPLVRNLPALPPITISQGIPVLDADVQAQSDLDVKAAKAAIEADGYKAVNVLGKGGNGTWRAKAYRGATEVQLVVDITGRVSAE